MERIPITKEGHNNLKVELERLKRVERPNNIKAIEEARAHGDLSENAEFHAAKERQSFLSGRIEELEYKIVAADIIDTDRLPKGEVMEIRPCLASDSSGPTSWYSAFSPVSTFSSRTRLPKTTRSLGKAIIGKKVYDELTLQVPKGKRCYEIVEIL